MILLLLALALAPGLAIAIYIYWRDKYHFGNVPLINYLPNVLQQGIMRKQPLLDTRIQKVGRFYFAFSWVSCCSISCTPAFFLDKNSVKSWLESKRAPSL